MSGGCCRRAVPGFGAVLAGLVDCTSTSSFCAALFIFISNLCDPGLEQHVGEDQRNGGHQAQRGGEQGQADGAGLAGDALSPSSRC